MDLELSENICNNKRVPDYQSNRGLNLAWRNFETELKREREREPMRELQRERAFKEEGANWRSHAMPCRCFDGYKTVVNSSKITSWHGNMIMMGFDGSVVTVVMSVAPHIRSCSQTGLTSFQQFVQTYSALYAQQLLEACSEQYARNSNCDNTILFAVR